MRHKFQEEFRQLNGRERMKRQREFELYLQHERQARRLFQESQREIERSQRQSQLRMRVTSVLQKLQRGIPLPSVHSFTNLIAQKPLHSIEWSPGGETLALIFNTDIELYSMGALLERQ